MRINILITGIGSSNSLSFIKGLRKQSEMNINIIGTDIYEKEFSAGSKFADSFFRVPRAEDPDFIPSLLDICKQNKVDVIVPIIDEEFMPIARRRNEFERIGTKIMLSGVEQILMCQDKFKTYQFLKNNGFPTPKTWAEVEDISNFPLLMKPRLGRGSRGIRVIQDQRELEMYGVKTDGYIYQEMINGDELTIDTLSDLNGRVLAAVPRMRLQIKDGVSYKSKTIRNKTVEEMCIKICETIGLQGPACLQCMLPDGNTPYFLEINPRIGSAVVLSIQAGINIPFLAVKSILGMKVDNMIGRFQENVIMLRYWDEVFI